jgi:hypothetical protein
MPGDGELTTLRQRRLSSLGMFSANKQGPLCQGTGGHGPIEVAYRASKPLIINPRGEYESKTR